MKNISSTKGFLLIPAISVLCSVNAIAQGSRQWTTSPLEDKAFIVNKGQFDGKDNLTGSQIYYGINNMGTQVYFTSKGLTYRYDVNVVERNNTKHKKPKESREEKEMVSTTYIANMEWLNSNPNVQLKVEGLLPQYYNFQKTVQDNKNLHKIPAYKKLYYIDLYPGIDVEYTFPDKGGVKYTLIVHPGADATKVKMKYTGATKMAKDLSGNLLLSMGSIGDITDHAPSTFYDFDNKAIASSFELNGDVVSFKLADYDHSKKVVIDPWTVSPGLINVNKAYDVTKNSAGDVLIYGGSSPFQVRKLNGGTGALIWSYTATTLGPYYGDMALDVNGNIYLTEGCCSRNILKLNPASTLMWTNTTATNFRELWRIGVSCKTPDLILAGGDPGTGSVMKVGKMDTTSGNITQMAVVGSGQEIRGIGIDPLGDIYTMHVTTGGGSGNSGNTATNDFVRSTPAFAQTWNVSSSYTLDEYCALYVSTNNFNGINAIAFYSNCVYTYNGSVINKRLKTTGALSTTATVAGAILNRNGGIAIDGCGFVYVGTSTGISKYDSTLTFISSISTTTEVYDLYVGVAGEIVAAGNGFVGSYAGLSACNSTCGCPAKTFTTAITNLKCPNTTTGAASVTASGGTGVYTYSWNNGQTGQNATGLSAGVYFCNVNDSIGCAQIKSVIITEPAAITPVFTATNVLCNGNSTGALTATSTGGTGGLTYSWSNGSTGTSTTGLTAGSYTLTVTDSLGCFKTSAFAVTEPTAISLVDSSTNLLCNGQTNGTSTAIISGGAGTYSYLWNNGQTTQTATGLAAGNYTVVISDGNGCSKTKQVTIFEPVALNLNAYGVSVNCTDDTIASANAIMNGGVSPYTYSWSNGATTAAINGLNTGSYTVTVTDASGCSKTQVVNVVVNIKPKASISANPTSGLVPLVVTFTNSSTGGVGYSWVFGDGNTANTMNTSNTFINGGTYTVMMIVTAANGCKDTAYITVIADGFSSIIVPNVFSPNSDGNNDLFTIETEGIKDLTLEIYDRWGLLMSTITNVAGGWDGKAKGGNDAPEGTYYYILKAHGIDDKEYNMKGYLMLMRK